MSNYNLNAGYGQITGQLPFLGVGKVFVVGDSSTVNLDMLKSIFGPDADGRVRYYATLQGAIDQASDNAGDRIYIMPGHTETVNSTGDVLIDVPGLTIEGIGQGDDVPLFDITSTSGKIQITQNDTTLKNVRVRPGAGSSGCAAVIELLSTSAARNIALDGVIWGPRSSQGAAFDTFISLGTNSSGANYFDGLAIKNNVFEYYTTSVTGQGYFFNFVTDGVDNFKFINNTGAMACSGVGAILQSSGTSYGWQIIGNRIHNQSTSITPIDINGTATYGISAWNLISSLSTGAKGTNYDSGALGNCENYFVCQSAANETAALTPATAVT